MSKGLNAREIQEIKKNDEKGWSEVHREYEDWVKHIRLVGPRVTLIIGLIAAIAVIVADQELFKVIGAVVFMYSVSSYSKWEGHREGYMDGYSEGIDAGVNRGLGIDNETDAQIRAIAIDMEIDELTTR